MADPQPDPQSDPQSDKAPAVAAQAAPVLRVRLTEQALELNGSIPDEETRRLVVEAASTALPDLPLTTVLEENPDVPGDSAAAAVRALEMMAFFAEGGFSVYADTVEFAGATFHQPAFAELAELAAAGWPAGYAADIENVSSGPDGPPVVASECEASIAAIIDRHPLAFEAGRAEIDGDAKPLLDRIAYELARCPQALVAVAGHTDSDGTDESNYRLSLGRADAVVDLLAADGIRKERFTALGYGESRPLASNGTLPGKARNRRTEFVLRD